MSMRIYQFNNFITDTGYILLAYLVKIIETFVFFQNRKIGKYLCDMPPRKMRRSSQEVEKMSIQAQARSPEVDELCTTDSAESAGSWAGGVGVGSGGSSADVGYRTG